MAKFSRFDPRNKKRGKHKQQSIYKDFRIKNYIKNEKNYLHSPQHMVEYTYNEGEYNEIKQLEQSDPN